MSQASFNSRTIVAFENALRDPFAAREILTAIGAGVNVPPPDGGGGETGGAITVDQLPTVGLVINQHKSLMTVDTDGETVTFDAAVSDWHEVLLGGSRTLALVNAVPHQEITLVLTQGGSGSNTVTWFPGIRWSGGVVPTLSTAVGKSDMFKLKQIAPNTYLGWIVGQGF